MARLWLTKVASAADDLLMAEERCKHDLVLGQCADCAPPPRGLARRVYRTAGGRVFHRTAACGGVLDGQAYAESQGMQTHPAELIDVVDAQAEGLGACLVCFPDYQPFAAKPKPCLIRIDGLWVPGTLLRWDRSADRRWQGLVTFTIDGEVFTTIKDHTDLRAAG